ncbi:MAG: N-acetylmuramoyl-L-alanine amidase [Rubrivivax sp.]|nr:N-acetylmuramoyl-L-alanine amidase [Rubrivivax sp.]
MAPQPRARTLAGGLAAALAALLVAALASGCAGGPAVDTRYTSPNQDSRVLFIVVHYTVGDFANALRTLTTNSDAPVSAHYLVGDAPPTVYRLVDESRRAWHAGASCWQDHCGLNASSVGIEIVNPGFRAGAWVPFPPGQIDAVVALIRDIAWRHAVRGDRILGHNEIQPQGKEDPGPLFPWRRLYDAGLIAWPTAQEIALGRAAVAALRPDVGWYQDKLVQHGFHLARTGELDEATRRVLTMFQMRYRPQDIAGEPDAETGALLIAVTSDSYVERAQRRPSYQRDMPSIASQDAAAAPSSAAWAARQPQASTISATSVGDAALTTSTGAASRPSTVP